MSFVVTYCKKYNLTRKVSGFKCWRVFVMILNVVDFWIGEGLNGEVLREKGWVMRNCLIKKYGLKFDRIICMYDK